jgi:hypothetical protein
VEREREKAAASFYDISLPTNSSVYLSAKEKGKRGEERGRATTLYLATATARMI